MYAWLDPWVARRPFEGRTARRYALAERPAFGDLDHRLLAQLSGELAGARHVLDVGSGTGELASLIAGRHPRARVLAVEPSSTFTRHGLPGVDTLRARGEALPLASGSVDLALCLSSLRHLLDRVAALRELRRVVAAGRPAYVIELDPEADAPRALRHQRALRSAVARWTFDPFLLRSGPTAATFAALALTSGWSAVETSFDPLQPVFILRLS